VLPMEDLSPQGDSDLNLGAALTFELTTNLQRISSLPRVISPRTARQFEGSALDPREIARELDVDGIIDASFQVIDDEIRVQIALVNATDGATVWAQTYQRGLRDLLTLQNQLARTIASEIGVALDASDTTALSNSREVDPHVLQRYEEALGLMSIGTDTSVMKAIELLNEIVRLAPDWAEPHGHLASACAWRWGFLGDHRDLIELGKGALATAMQLDPDLALNHSARAMQEFWFNFDLPAAKAAFARARELDALDPVLAMQDAIFWSFARDFDRAVATGQRAMRLDPMNPSTSRQLAWIYYDAGRWENALAQHDVTRRVLEQFPDANEALSTEYQTTWSLLELGRISELRSVAAEHDISLDLMDSCRIMLAEGDTLFVRTALERPYWEQGPWERDSADALRAQLGDPDPLFTSIDAYYRDRNPRLWWVMNESVWPQSVLGDPRWAEWRQRLGLPD
jgi:TolB-like protein